MSKKVYLGMSGGVDSSVSAVLLQRAGYEVIGVYMKNWSKDLPGMKCPWADDLADAKRVAVGLGIDFEVWDFEAEYKSKVVDYMLAEFQKGRTPNPDIMCNQEVKFKLFYEVALERGADYIATGHYALTDSEEQNEINNFVQSLRGGEVIVKSNHNQNTNLCMAVDENKDQTYFLYRISDEALAKTIFPLGSLTKPDVKKMAEEFGLDVASKKESMGVCFVGEVGMKEFLQEYLETKPGEIRELESDEVLGYHEGAVLYTIGQRHGLNLGGGLPYYVAKKDMERNIVYVSRDLNDKNLWAQEIELEEILVRNADMIKDGKIQVRLRHRAPLIEAEFKDNKIIFAKEVKKPDAGQSAVFYKDNICIGGGIIAA